MDFAKSLAGDAQQNGVAAFRLNEGEAREWRAFRALIGPDADLTAVAACWERSKAKIAPALSLSVAIAEYTAAKEAEGVSAKSIAHYAPIFDDLTEMLGDRNVSDVSDADIVAYMAALKKWSENTKRTRFARVRALFNWLVSSRKLDHSPFVGMKPPKVSAREVEILTLKQSQDLFSKNAKNEDGRPIDKNRRELRSRVLTIGEPYNETETKHSLD